MEKYKQDMAQITAPESLRARIAAIPQQEDTPQKKRRSIRYPRRVAAVAAVLVVVLLAGIIGIPAMFSMQKSASYDAYDYNSDYAYSSNSKSLVRQAAAGAYDGFAEESAEGIAAASTSGSVLPAGRKLIRDATLQMETKEFDSFLSSLRQKTAAFKGYTENSSVGENYDGTRHGSIVVRIPAEKLDEFLEGLDEVGTVTSREESLRDVTQEYIDKDSRIRALETEQQTLLDLLEKAEKLKDVLEIQSRLSEVRATLESYKGQMQVLENQIDYSAVTIYVEEVKRFTPAEEKSFGAQLRSNLSENLYGIGQGARNFALWLLSSLPYFVLIALLAGVVVLVVVLIRRKRRRIK